MKAQEITFEEICHIWQKELWPSRVSPIETHSAMTWPFDGNQLEYDMDIFEYKPSFFGIFDIGFVITFIMIRLFPKISN